MDPILKNSTAMNKKMALIFSLPEVSGSQWTFAGRQKKGKKRSGSLQFSIIFALAYKVRQSFWDSFI